MLVNQVFELFVGKQTDQLLMIVAFDDEALVKEWVSDFEVFHSEEFADRREEAFTVDLEVEAVLVDERGLNRVRVVLEF